MDIEQKKRIEDFFTTAELVDFLQIPIDDFIDLYFEEIDDAMDDIEELMGVRHDDG